MEPFRPVERCAKSLNAQSRWRMATAQALDTFKRDRTRSTPTVIWLQCWAQTSPPKAIGLPAELFWATLDCVGQRPLPPNFWGPYDRYRERHPFQL